MVSTRTTKVLERKVFSTGDMIIEQGENAASAYLIQQGKVRVFTGQDSLEVTLATVEAGQIIGEMGLFGENKKRTASVQALEKTTVIEITPQTLQMKVEKSDPTVGALVSMMSERIVKSNGLLENLRKETRRLELHIEDVEKTIRASLPLMDENEVEEKIDPAIKDLMHALKVLKEEIVNITSTG